MTIPLSVSRRAIVTMGVLLSGVLLVFLSTTHPIHVPHHEMRVIHMTTQVGSATTFEP